MALCVALAHDDVPPGRCHQLERMAPTAQPAVRYGTDLEAPI